MQQKVSKILLIDDSEAINFIHNFILEELNCANEVIIKENGEEAINYLKSLRDIDSNFPELIFLDINMPKLNAWEFIEEFRLFDESSKIQSRIFLMTSSIDPGDALKANSYQEIQELKDKPFDEAVIKQIIEKYIH